MNNVTIFENKEFGQVRTFEQDDQVWFVAKDVCDCLAINYTSKAASKLEADELMRIKLPSGGQTREMLAVNEYGLYNLVLRSNKPEAKQFKRWITHEVLPSIRQHGGYVQGQEDMSPEELMARALQYANSKMKELQGRLEEKEVETSRLIVENNKMIPKAEYFDALVDRNLLTSFRDTAKQLGVREKLFVQFLLDKKYIYRNKHGKLKPYAEKGEGLFEIKEFLNSKNDFAATQTLITPKGREVFRLLTQGL